MTVTIVTTNNESNQKHQIYIMLKKKGILFYSMFTKEIAEIKIVNYKTKLLHSIHANVVS